MEEEAADKPLDFIRSIISNDRENGKNEGRVHTRFPPNQMDTFIWVMPRAFA